MGQGLLSRVQSAIARPSEGMSWPQLGAAVIFVGVVLLAWRQVVRWGMKEL